jgi:hypothetical protein
LIETEEHMYHDVSENAMNLPRWAPGQGIGVGAKGHHIAVDSQVFRSRWDSVHLRFWQFSDAQTNMAQKKKTDPSKNGMGYMIYIYIYLFINLFIYIYLFTIYLSIYLFILYVHYMIV